MDWINKVISKRPIQSSLILVVLGALLAFICATFAADIELKKILWTAGVTLIFGAFLGGIVKILFDDFQRKKEKRAREEREDFERKRQARAALASFISNILDDLKSVYDRVERARILVPAHKSAKTYGDEMRDLIEARVKLLNVERALKRGESRIEGPDKQNKLERYVECMHEYLKTLTDEFKEEYRPIALSQARFEAQRDQWKEDLKKDQAKDPPENQAWQKLRCLPALKDFMGLSEPNCNSHEDNSESGKEASSYEERFSKPLGYATELLRNELNTIYKK